MTLTGYVTAYVTKAETSGLQDVWSDLASSGTLYSRLWRFSKSCFKNREVGLYEATDQLVGDHFTEKSAQVQFVNARFPNKRTRVLINYHELKELKTRDPNSTSMYKPSLIDVHYPSRPDLMVAMCLYNFAKNIDWYHRDKNGDKTFRTLTKPRVVNHPVFDPHRKEQEQDYYYCLILLFVPFTDEADLLQPGETAKQAFGRLEIDGLIAHHEKLQKMLEASKKRKDISEARKAERDENEAEEDGVQVKGKSRFEEPLHLDECVDHLNLDQRVSMLNGDQRKVYETFAAYLLHEQKHENNTCTCADLEPLHMFVSGVGGTGKSFLIHAIRAFVKATWPDLSNVSAVAAPTGLAACNVGGVTTYQLFQLPIEHDSKTAAYWALPRETLKFLREQLVNVKLFIVDEVSMVSSLNLAYINMRLGEIYGGDEWFGGKNMMFVGDILQLPPVNGAPVFQRIPPEIVKLRLHSIDSRNIWLESVVYDELTINERQKSDKVFTDVLDGVRRGFPSDEALALLHDRVFDKPVADVYNRLVLEGKNPICLFPTRKACALVNNELLNSLESKIVPLPCKDVIDEAASAKKWDKKAEERRKVMDRDSNLTAGLEAILHLAVGARVMLRRNLSTEEGLVNGAIGTVRKISPSCVTVKFDTIAEPCEVRQVINRFCVLDKFYVHRQQFPLIVAYAVTIHKSQGLSLDCAIIDLSDNVFGDGMAYVALSRVRSLDGVYLTSFTPKSIMASRVCVQECNRLRKKYRPDLPQYRVPLQRKRKLPGIITPACKKARIEQPQSKGSVTKKPRAPKPLRTPQKVDTCRKPQPKRGVKRNIDHVRDEPPSKKAKTVGEEPDCILVQSCSDGETFVFNPLDVNSQKLACSVFEINHWRNIVAAGGLNVTLTSPNLSALVNTIGDGSCMFRAMCFIMTGYQRQHKAVRRAIVKHLCDNDRFFLTNPLVFDTHAFDDMEAYVETKRMRLDGWGSTTELYALAHMLRRRVFTYTLLGRTPTWHCLCPSKVDRTIPPPVTEQGLYLYHTGNHYMVVKSLCK